MIKQEFSVDNYWEVIVYYDLNYEFLEPIYKELKTIGFSKEGIRKIFGDLKSQKAKAVTCSNLEMCVSIVLFNPHDDKYDYFNSLIHEAEHIKQAMLAAYDVEDVGEPPAYTIGYLAMRMWKVFRYIIYNWC